MEACASTHSAYKLGALTIQQNHVRGGGRGEDQEDAYVSRLHIMEWEEVTEEEMREVKVGGVLSEDMDLEGSLYRSGECGQHFFGGPGLSPKRIF